MELAHEMLAGARLLVATARETVILATETGRSTALDMAYAVHKSANKGEDAQEGLRAFAEKRMPEWKGK